MPCNGGVEGFTKPSIVRTLSRVVGFMSKTHCEVSRQGRLFDHLALGILAALPPISVISTRSAPLVLGIFTVLALIGRWRDGALGEVKSRVLAAFRSWPAAAIAVGLIFVWISCLWSPDASFSAEYAAQLTGNAILITIAVAVVPALPLRWCAFAIMAGVIVGGAMILIEFVTGGGILLALGQPPVGAYRLNRVVVTTVVIALIALAFWRGGREKWPSFLVIGFVAWVSMVSESGAGMLGLLAGIIALAIAFLAPSSVLRMIAIAAVAITIAMPALAPEVNTIMPASAHKVMRGASSEVRGEIWRLYARIGQEHPLRGFGLEASRFIVDTDYADGLSPFAIELLEYGHPHNAPLQAWFELGVLGPAVIAFLLFVLAIRLDRSERELKPYLAAVFAALFSIACISHGAWQAWWVSVIGVSFVWWRILLLARAQARAA